MANDIKYDIIADATRFGNGVRNAEKDALRLHNTMSRISSQSAESMNGFGKSGRNGSMIIQQLAFAAEDAATQFGTRGLAGAIMAAGNNITFVASMMGGPIGVITSLVLTGTMLAMTYFRIGNNAKTAANDVDVFADALRSQQDQLKENIKFQQKLADLRTGEKAESERKGIAEDIEQRAASIEDLKRQAKNLQGVIDTAKKNNSGLDQEYGFVGQWMFGSDVSTQEKQLSKLRELLNQEEQEVAKSRSRLSQLKESSPEIKAREETDKATEKAKQDAEDQKKLIEDLANESMTAQDRYLKRMQEIQSLRSAGKITEAESAKYATYAADQLEQQTQSQRSLNQLLTGAMDIRSAEAFGVMAKAEARSRLTRGFSIPQFSQAQLSSPVPEVKSDGRYEKMEPQSKSPEVQAIEQRISEWLNRTKGSESLEKDSAVGIKRIGDILERRPSIPVVGLN